MPSFAAAWDHAQRKSNNRPVFPTGPQEFVDLVVPELQRRGLFRTECEGRTLRDHLGLPFPQSRHTAAADSAGVAAAEDAEAEAA